MVSFHSIRALRISLASPEQIRALSSGEVTSAETINYRTLKPEHGGLFCERIFGPTKNWTCACGKYHSVKDKGKTCERCGVRVTSARVRRTRMGHIELAAPVCHAWYATGVPSKLALLLDLTQRELNAILSFTHYVVLHVDEVARKQELDRIQAEIARVESLDDNSPLRGEDASSQQKRAQAGVGRVPAPVPQGPAVDAASSTAPAATLDVLQAMGKVDLEELLLESEMDEDAALEAEMYLEGEAQGEEVSVYASAGDFPSIGDYVRHLQRVEGALWQLSPGGLLNIERYRLLHVECGHIFRAGIGAEAIQELLARLDLEALARSLRQQLYGEKDGNRARLVRRLKVIEAIRRSHTDPRAMVLNVLPVLPPDLRPVVPVGAGRFASADVNELYSRILHVNNRLKRFLSYGAPELMLFHEKRMLQETCDALLDNRHRPQPLLGSQGQILRSLTDSLSGKKGLFRHNLLGKRVDYSGRSVICVGPDLRIDQCGLPKKMALELFKPFIVHRLLTYNIVQTPRQARRAVEQRLPVVWDILAEVMRGRYVLLNRAPTLHRLSIQAFEPVLIEGSAIRLPPLVCSAFNADFDGDQMAVHLPLSAEAQQEAGELMLAARNLLSPASGEPAISISQDIVLGCFYLTQGQPGKKGEGHVFSDANEAILAHQQGIVDLHASIFVRMEQETVFEQPLPALPARSAECKRIRTTVGRLLFNAALPKRLRFKNYAMKKEFLKQTIAECVQLYGLQRAAVMADAIKRLGFAYATRAGISFAISDVVVPASKRSILAEADEKIRGLDTNWRSGLITTQERSQRAIEIWSATTQRIEQAIQGDLDPFGPLATISNSGATKARLQQIRQLSGMRGLMASPSGAIIETPVRSNFLEGLNVAEYFISSHGARKSLMDKSLNTAEAGYLTIRLVNVAQEVVVTEEDCGTGEGFLVTADDSAAMGLADSRSRLIGRVLAEDIPALGLSIGDELDEDRMERLISAGLVSVRVRSVLSCQARQGVCRKCYGWDLSRRALVQEGTPVGIVAAQSIGEPGTQLTMRTFHSGGIAGGQGDITQGIARVEELFEARVPKDPALISEGEGVVEVSKEARSGKHLVRIAADHPLLYEVPATRKLLLHTGQSVRVGEPITAGSLDLHSLLRLRGREVLERYLLIQVQSVYRTTGAYIHDKHFEIIIRQMLRRASIDHPGDSDLLPGDLIDRLALANLSAHIEAQGGDPPITHTILLGVTRATLATESWLAAAAFQQTGKVLAEAALEGRTDFLVGLKENVIAGRLIPAGTGDSTRLARAERRRLSAQSPRRRRGRPRKKRVL